MFLCSQSFPLETPIFLREYNTGLYRVDVYFLSKMFAEVKSVVIFIFFFFSRLLYMYNCFMFLSS